MEYPKQTREIAHSRDRRGCCKAAGEVRIKDYFSWLAHVVSATDMSHSSFLVLWDFDPANLRYGIAIESLIAALLFACTSRDEVDLASLAT